MTPTLVSDTPTRKRTQIAPLGLNARKVARKRYSIKDEQGNPLEEWPDIVKRVVDHVSQAETDPTKRQLFHDDASEIMLTREFIPNTPCLVNAGLPNGQLAACFVLQIPDSLDGIMEHAATTAKIHQTGGGTGMTYEALRPYGATVSRKHGTASGPVSFMSIVNQVTEVVKQGGVRRGANMGMMRVTHPDILRFIHSKNDQHSLTNFNISVNVTDKFLAAVDNNEWFQLEFDGKAWTQPIYDPITDGKYAIYVRRDDYPVAADFKPPRPLTFCDREAFLAADLSAYRKVDPPEPGLVYAPDIWNRIVASAHKYAEPGIAFIDEVNRHNHMMASMGPIYSCNPCGEQFLHANNSCNLGSIDVSKFYEYRRHEPRSINCINWERLSHVVHTSIQFLDNVIDTCHWPLPEIEDTVKRTRPVGLGIMGFADLCLKLQITYGSPESCSLMHDVMGYVRREAWRKSLELGSEKGTFPEFEANREAYTEFLRNTVGLAPELVPYTPRNYETTTCAPTGTISLVAETSSGVEPNFSWAYIREDTIGRRTYLHPLAAEALGLQVDFTNQDSIEVSAAYVVDHLDELPPHFISAMDISSEQHVRVLAATQANVDNSVSKTCNGKNDDSIESVRQLYQLARQLGCKAVSYYRDGSRDHQVLTSIKKEEPKEIPPDPTPTLDELPPVPAAVEPRTSQQIALPAPDRADRPKELTGSTWQIPFDGQNLYVTVNHNGKQIQEIFVNGPISASVGKLASKMLRGGFHVKEVAHMLETTTGTHSVWFNERLLTSPEQAIAECLLIMLRRLEGKKDSAHANTQLQQTDTADSPTVQRTIRACPDCNGPLNRVSNCDVCQDCSYSKCG